PGPRMTFISRRDLLKRAGMAGAAAALPLAHLSAVPPSTQPARGALEHFSAQGAELLDAIVGRLIPTDELGPGAREAGVVRYIDRALGGALASFRQAYTSGLSALERHARSSRGKSFLELPPGDQDSVLTEIETGAATGFSGSSAVF